jgi:hypothetical protein
MATKTFTGTLVVLNTKKGNGARGPWTAYSGKVVRPNGEEYEEWLSFGFKKPDCAQGDEVVITAKKEEGFWKVTDVEVTKPADSEESGSVASSGSGTGASSAGSSVPQESSSSKASPSGKEQKIHYQNSRTAAIQVADLLLKHKAVPLSATTGKAGEAKRFEEVTALVNKLTVILYHDLESFRLVNDIEDVYEAQPAAEPGFDDAQEGDGQDD